MHCLASAEAEAKSQDCAIAINGTESGVDDPDRQLCENSLCGRCATIPAIETEGRQADRLAIGRVQLRKAQAAGVADRKPVGGEGARPIISIRAVNLAQPADQLVRMVNGIYNGHRMEDVWLDK